MSPNLAFDAARDLASVLMIGSTANVMIVPNSRPWKTIQDFIADAKGKPGVASCQHADLSRVRQRAYSQFLVPNQKECLPDPRDPTLLDSLLFRSALFVVEAAAA